MIKHLSLVGLALALVLTQIGCMSTEVEEGDRHLHVFGRYNFPGAKRKVAVVKFENKAPYGGELGDTAATVMASELRRSGYFDIYDRSNLGASARELRYSGGRVFHGRLGGGGGMPEPVRVSLDAIVIGTVTNFSVQRGGHDYFFYQEKYWNVECTVDVQVINQRNSQVIGGNTGHARFKERHRGTGILGGGSGATYPQGLAQKALRRAIDDCIEKVIQQLGSVPAGGR